MNVPDHKLLVLLIDGRRAGIIIEGPSGSLTLTYNDEWRESGDATPLSLSMPLTVSSHHDDVVRPFLWGLLPDNEQVLERWGREHQVSARNPFALLRHVGEDCAGTCQFASLQRVDPLLAANGGVDWIDETEIAERLRTLRHDPTAWHMARNGQFSLAGVQAKTALHYDERTGRWGDPNGSTPTTHIIKPAITGFDDHDLNEFLCLGAARRLGLPAASARVMPFGDERAIVVERYDRVRAQAGVRRVHQEDMCQALGVMPTAKYQNEGGPSPERIIGLIRQQISPVTVAEESVGRFVDALAFNWIIGGTDAHAKNYSLLLARQQVRLAPMYDVASALPYDDMYLPKLRMAMKIGGEYLLEGISGRHWRRFAQANNLSPESTIERVDDLAARVPDSFAAAARDVDVETAGGQLPGRLVERITARARRCRDALRR
jgi:serine/threonine-protein kinase HipA